MAATGKIKGTSGSPAYRPCVRITREFCDRIESCEVVATRLYVRNAQLQFPDLNAQICDIGGGVAAYTGAGSPLSESTGVGLWQGSGSVDAGLLTAFYRERGAQPRVRLSPHADARFVRALITLGYEPIDYENLMAADLLELLAQRDERVQEMRDATEWSRATGSAFRDGEACDDANLQVGLLICTVPEATALEIRVDEGIAATGCVDFQGEVAGLFAAATAPAHRGQGLHRALVLDRAARAIERGARFARVTARPASASEQNFRRLGFAVLYTRTLWGIP
jgi:GNAT superfamily N-acetyltransferase